MIRDAGFSLQKESKGRVTHSRFVDGTECWFDYDADGRMTKRKDKNGILHTN